MPSLKCKDSQGNIKPVRVAAINVAQYPELDNPAATTDVILGKEYIDENGQKQTGTMLSSLLANYSKSLNFTSVEIPYKYVSIDNAFITGNCPSFQSAIFPNDAEIYLNVNSLTSLSYAFAYINVKKITIRADFSDLSSLYHSFRENSNLEIIDATLDLTKCTNTSYLYGTFFGCSALREIRFKPNTLAINNGGIFSGCNSLSDETLLSIANCLKDGLVKTLTLPTSKKTRCGQIIGNVSQVTEDEITYNFFTADESGTITLAQFITQTKGWTLA